MPYYGDTALPYYYGSQFSNHSSLMTGTGRSFHGTLGVTRYAPHLTTIVESPLSALRRYTPATATMTTGTGTATTLTRSRPRLTIDTADIDVSTPRSLSNGARGDQRLNRDRPTIRIRSRALKNNPALREHNERHEKSVGELLVEKFLIKEKKSPVKMITEPRTEDSTIQRRITRRMTRRRSSADVQMNAEQLERKAKVAQAQAHVLDTLVAEEQAEIEVETRMGTLVRKNFPRTTVAPRPQVPKGENDRHRRISVEAVDEKGAKEEEEEEEKKENEKDEKYDKMGEKKANKCGNKVKKRRKTADEPSPSSTPGAANESISEVAARSDRGGEIAEGGEILTANGGATTASSLPEQLKMARNDSTMEISRRSTARSGAAKFRSKDIDAESDAEVESFSERSAVVGAAKGAELAGAKDAHKSEDGTIVAKLSIGATSNRRGDSTIDSRVPRTCRDNGVQERIGEALKLVQREIAGLRKSGRDLSAGETRRSNGVAGKLAEAPVDATPRTVDGESLGNDPREVTDEIRKIAEPSDIGKSSKIGVHQLTRNANFGKKFNVDVGRTGESTKSNEISKIGATRRRDERENVVDSRKNGKDLPHRGLGIGNDAGIESLPDQSDIRVTTLDRSKREEARDKKLVAVANGEAVTKSSKISKALAHPIVRGESETKTEIEKTISEKKFESLPYPGESAKLSNVAVNREPIIEETSKSEFIEEIGEKKVSRVPEVEEEIDFWGEIESREIGREKPIEEVVNVARKREITGEIGLAGAKDEIGDSTTTATMMVPKLETKYDPSFEETGTRGDATETKTRRSGGGGGEEEPVGKVRRKKTSEGVGLKKVVKKDRLKMSAETILGHADGIEAADETTTTMKKKKKKKNSSERQAEQLELRSGEKLDDRSAASTRSGEDNVRETLEIGVFVERNLSTIDEECPVGTRNIDRATRLIVPSPEDELDKDLPLPSVNGQTIEGSVTNDIAIQERTSLPETETSTGADDESKREAQIHESKDLPPLFGISVPTINIVEAQAATTDEITRLNIIPEKETTSEAAKKEEAEGEEEEEDSGTPTNGTVEGRSDEISKCQGLADLPSDKPLTAGSEVASESKKKIVGSGKKKVGSSKKASKKSSTKSAGSSADSSKKRKLVKRKKSTTKSLKDEAASVKSNERNGSKLSNASEATLRPGGLGVPRSPYNSGRNSPKQRPLDLIKMFYTTPTFLLTATPRDLSKVRRAKIKKKKHSSRTTSASSDSTGSTRSTQSTGTTASAEREDRVGQKRVSSTRSNDSGFDGSPRLSNCDMACHKKCEKLTGNLCGLNQKLVSEALQALKRAPSQSSENQRTSDGSDHHTGGRVTPPATNLPRFKKYTVMDFNFLKVLGKGSFGKVLLAELRRTDCVYAVKCLKKDVVLEDDDVECTLIERKVLTLATRHPYLCHLFCTFQTDSHLFFVMEYLNGGDLMFHIQKSGRFPETRARFYAAEIWSGLNFLHKKGIVYRDLKLDNVLLDFEGHIRIADFGMCKLQIFLDRTADTFCGTPDYMAPEIIKGLKYNQAVDWWSYGVLLYEMLTGQSPFSGCDEDELFWSICNERPFIPRYLSQEAMDVLICLLEKDAGKRPSAHEIAAHPFFHSVAWERLERRQLEAPFKPSLEHTLDTRYFDTAFTVERPRLTPIPEQILTSMDQGIFRGFSYTNPNATD